MPSPFPGMDPYLEDPKHWSNFHLQFVARLLDELNACLPDNYWSSGEERIQIVREEDHDTELTLPDASIIRSGPNPILPQFMGNGENAVAVLEREPVLLPIDLLEEETTRYIRIVRYPENELVTVIELFSPANKTEPGYTAYLEHRQEWFHQQVHLVELDLLLAGKRFPLRVPLPKGDYYALVARVNQRPNAEVYAWTIRDSLPKIRVPLTAPDPDLIIDLQAILTTVYDRGRFQKNIRYGTPIRGHLSENDRAWAMRQGV